MQDRISARPPAAFDACSGPVQDNLRFGISGSMMHCTRHVTLLALHSIQRRTLKDLGKGHSWIYKSLAERGISGAEEAQCHGHKVFDKPLQRTKSVEIVKRLCFPEFRSHVLGGVDCSLPLKSHSMTLNEVFLWEWSREVVGDGHCPFVCTWKAIACSNTSSDLVTLTGNRHRFVQQVGLRQIAVHSNFLERVPVLSPSYTGGRDHCWNACGASTAVGHSKSPSSGELLHQRRHHLLRLSVWSALVPCSDEPHTGGQERLQSANLNSVLKRSFGNHTPWFPGCEIPANP
eukprot:65291-Amphidinium_carterae.1